MNMGEVNIKWKRYEYLSKGIAIGVGIGIN